MLKTVLQKFDFTGQRWVAATKTVPAHPFLSKKNSGTLISALKRIAASWSALQPSSAPDPPLKFLQNIPLVKKVQKHSHLL